MRFAQNPILPWQQKEHTFINAQQKERKNNILLTSSSHQNMDTLITNHRFTLITKEEQQTLTAKLHR